MVIAVILAWWFPAPGAEGGILQPELMTDLGVALIFFLHGISLSFSALRDGLLQWKQHLLVQSCVFLLFPLVGVALFWGLHGLLPEDLRIGLLFLCALPSTVSSSVALTATANGHIPIALFSATISSLLGVVLTPLWMMLAVKSGESSGSLMNVVFNLFLMLVLPLIVGQLCRPWLASWGQRNKKLINNIDRLIILFLIYTSFCDSFVMGVWTNSGLVSVCSVCLLSLLIFSGLFWSIWRICLLLRLPEANRIAILFCGSKKSLATGIPMAQVMFSGHPGMGLILLPIMIYHPLQLVICGVMANRWKNSSAETSGLAETLPESPQD